MRFSAGLLCSFSSPCKGLLPLSNIKILNNLHRYDLITHLPGKEEKGSIDSHPAHMASAMVGTQLVSETEQRVLELHDRLQQLSLELALLKARREYLPGGHYRGLELQASLTAFRRSPRCRRGRVGWPARGSLASQSNCSTQGPGRRERFARSATAKRCPPCNSCFTHRKVNNGQLSCDSLSSWLTARTPGTSRHTSRGVNRRPRTQPGKTPRCRLPKMPLMSLTSSTAQATTAMRAWQRRSYGLSKQLLGPANTPSSMHTLQTKHLRWSTR